MADENSVSKPRENPPARVAGFTERYANNVQFESSVWDLKMIFGVFDNTSESPGLKQHTSINVTWQQAKVIAYFLYVNVMFQEISNGPIRVPKPVVPASFDSFLQEFGLDDTNLVAMKDRLNRLREELFGTQT